MYDDTLELTREVDHEVRDFFGEIVFRTVIPRDVAVAEAPSHGRSVMDYAPARAAPGLTSNSAWRYSSVNKERRLGRGLEALLGRPLESYDSRFRRAATRQPAASRACSR